MGKIAFIFSGQGAQYVGMGKEMAENFEASNRVFENASESAGYDMKKMVFEGDEATLKITENTQPAILTTSIACLKPLLENGVTADVAAGLSLGEYSAHVAAGTMDFSDAVLLVKKRGKYMQEAVPVDTGTMAAIIGLEDQAVIECCKEASKAGIVEPANFNCPGQMVIAGEIAAVEEAVRLCGEKGAKRALVLPVSAPFHCSMLKPAGEKLSLEIDRVNLKDMNIPVVANVNGEYIYEKEQVKDLLVRQVSSPVMWEKSVRNMISDGVDTFVEIGPGKVLSGFLRRIDKSLNTYNIENMDTFEKTLNALKDREVNICN